MESGARFVSPTGYIDLDNDCEYSIDRKSTRSRENVNPKEDLGFYFQTYLAPKYGLDNINVSNVASFMKELEMNWSKMTPDLKNKVLDIMVDNILSENYDFKTQLLSKLGVENNHQEPRVSKSTFGSSKSNFGSSIDTEWFTDMKWVMGGILLVLVIIFVLSKIKSQPIPFPKMS